MLVTVPFVLLLLDYWPLGRMQKAEGRMQNGEADHAPRSPHQARRFIRHPASGILLEKLPFFALAAASCVVTVLAQQQAMQPLSSLSLGARAGNAAVACARYLGKVFWPMNLAAPYPHPGHWPAPCSTRALTPGRRLRLAGNPGPFDVLRGGINGEGAFVLNQHGPDHA